MSVFQILPGPRLDRGEPFAKFIKIPKIEAKEVVPYTRNEIVKIIAACDEFGRTSYERRRAHAMGY